MIHVVLSAVVSSLNEFIRNELNLQEDVVILTNAVDLSGNLNSQIDNKLCVFLQNLDEERVIRNGGYQSYAGSNPPKHFNLHVMFVANFPDPNYLEALRYISLVLEFFQGTQVFSKFNLPTLSANVEKLSVEFVNFTFDELNSVWNVIGLKYMPSASYKIKLLTFTNNLIREQVSLVGITSNKGGSGPFGIFGPEGSQGNNGPEGSQRNNGPEGSQRNNGPSGNQSPPIFPREMNPIGDVRLIKDMQEDMANDPSLSQGSFNVSDEQYSNSNPRVRFRADDFEEDERNNPDGTAGPTDPSLDSSVTQGASDFSDDQYANSNPRVRFRPDDFEEDGQNNPDGMPGPTDPSLTPPRERKPVDNNQIIKDVDDPFMDNTGNNNKVE